MAETKKGIPLMNLNDVADITQVNRGFNKIDELLESHENKKIIDENGVHGLRYNEEDEELEYLDNKGNWESLTGVGGGAVANISPVKNIKVIKGNGTLKISWQDPEDLTWAGTKLVYKLGSYPQNPKDGNLVVDNTVKNQYKNNGVDVNALTNGSKYYFMFFPYDSKNKYSFDVENRVVGIPTDYKVMTVKIDLNNSNPETSCTYHDDAVGMTPRSEEWDEFFGHYPCWIKAGKEILKVNPNNFHKDINGNDIQDDNFTNESLMICFPRIGIKAELSNNLIIIKITNNPENKDFYYIGHDFKGKKYKKCYLGVYKGSVNSYNNVSNALVSRSDRGLVHGTPSQLIQFALNNFGEYNIKHYNQHLMLQFMYILKYKNLNSQYFLGPGRSTGKTGGSEIFGMDSVNNNDIVKLFGLEDFWGNNSELLAGLRTSDQDIYLNDKNYGLIINKNLHPVDWFYLSYVNGNQEIFFLPSNNRPSDKGSSSTYFTDQVYLQPNTWASIKAEGGETGIFNIWFNQRNEMDPMLTTRLMYLNEEVTE